MSIFAIADVHLSLGVKKPMDIFHGWQDYEKRLEENWRHLFCLFALYFFDWRSTSLI